MKIEEIKQKIKRKPFYSIKKADDGALWVCKLKYRADHPKSKWEWRFLCLLENAPIYFRWK